MQKIEIDVGAGGVGKILVDGKDMSGMVSGANIRIRAGKLTSVFLQMAADTKIEVDGKLQSSTINGRVIWERK